MVEQPPEARCLTPAGLHREQPFGQRERIGNPHPAQRVPQPSFDLAKIRFLAAEALRLAGEDLRLHAGVLPGSPEIRE